MLEDLGHLGNQSDDRWQSRERPRAYRNSPRDVLLQHAAQKVLRHRVDVHRHVESTIANLVQQDTNVVVVERQTTGQECVKDHSTRPDIGDRTLVSLSRNDFGTCVVRAPTARPQESVTALPSGHTEVGDLDILVAIQEKVLWLEVTVSDVETMTVVDGVDDLLEVVDSFGGRQAAA